MLELPIVEDSFFVGPDIAFHGDLERAFEVWQGDGKFYWAEVDRDGGIISAIAGPFSSARCAHRDALLAASKHKT